MSRKIRKRELNLNQKVIGSFGTFYTNKSDKLDYMMCTININDIDILSTQSDVFNFESVDFNEIVQRDVNIDRIDNEIIKNYLEKNEETIFFPPILVSPILVDENKKPKNQFKDVTENTIENMKEEEQYIKTWDDAMRLNLLYTEEHNENHEYTRLDGEKIKIVNYASEFLYNDKKLKLVVIDGQHRFLALKRIYENDVERDLIKDIDIPICIFFMPDAVETQSSTQTMNRGMRKLFVTINSEAKKVSGHFIELLKDDSLSSITVRSLADHWKKQDSENGRLHYIEWNQHQDKKAYTVTKDYSITTVSILSESLRKSIFNDKSYTKLFLNLGEISEELNSLNGTEVNEIKDSSFGISQIDLLSNQIKNNLLPSLETLLIEPKAYNKLTKKFTKALEWLDDKSHEGAKYYKNKILYEFRTLSHRDLEYETLELIEDKFYEHLYFDNDEEEFFYRNIFQQAYLKSWAEFYYELSSYFPKLKLFDFTKCFVDALQSICFNDDDKIFFSSYNEYTQNIIFKNKRLLINDTSREQIKNLIHATFLNEEQKTNFVNHISEKIELDKVKLNDIIYNFSEKAINSYILSYKQITLQKLKKEWQFIDLPIDIKQTLERLYKNTKKDHETIHEINNIFSSVLNKKLEKASIQLTNNIDISSEIIDMG